MMRVLILSVLLLSGCATVQEWIPSFWDPNQSARIVDIRLDVMGIDCSQPQMAQLKPLQRDLLWFKEYSTSKGMTQGDVLRVVAPIDVIVTEWAERGEASKGYCTIKKKLLLEQTERASKVIQGRW